MTTLQRADAAPSATGPAGPASSAGLPPLARRPVLGLTALVAAVLAACSPFYGWFGDELYFVAAGEHPAWGYADQPPVLPLLAAGLHALMPGSPALVRLPAVLATAAMVLLAALIAREMGGRARAQVMAAGAVAVSFYLLASGRLLATSTLDPFWWTLLLWLVVRWVRTDRDGRADDRLLVLAGVVLAVALNTKFLVLGLVAGLAVGVLAVGPRRLLGRPMLWVGLAIAAAATVPTLIWQATHGWPQLAMGGVVAGEAELFGNRWQFLPMALVFAGLLPGVILVVLGVWALLRRPALAPWRFLGIAVLVTTAALLIAGGRPYYVAGFFAALYAAGAVALQDRPARRWWAWTTGPVVFVISGVLVALAVLPIGPSASRDQTDFTTMGQVGWPEFAAGVGQRWHELPGGGQGVVIASQYWYAGALEQGREAAGLPAVFSPHRGYGYLAVPPGQEPALLVGSFADAGAFCATLTPVAPYVAAHTTPVLGTVPLATCTPRAPWAAMWPSMRTMA